MRENLLAARGYLETLVSHDGWEDDVIQVVENYMRRMSKKEIERVHLLSIIQVNKAKRPDIQRMS